VLAKRQQQSTLEIGLTLRGKKTLLVDADAQCNPTESLGYSEPDKLLITLATFMAKVVTGERMIPSMFICIKS
jgi:chromosome partitioning protein